MEDSELFSHIDETNVQYHATRSDIRRLCDEALAEKAASIVIPPSYVSVARSYVGDHLAVGTVISYPHGFDTSASKGFLTSDAINNGADEIACTINNGWIFDEKWNDIEAETAFIKKACGNHLLKILMDFRELLTEQKRQAAEAAIRGGADMIGLLIDTGSSSAVLSDLELLKDLTEPETGILAYGPVRTLKTASRLLGLGATRVSVERQPQ